MPDSHGFFEVFALFAVAALICWPALRGRFPALQRRGKDSAPPEKESPRYEPKRASTHFAAVEPVAPLTANPIPDAIYEDQEPWHPDTNGSSYDGDAEEGVLPLAEALLRGERVVSHESASSSNGSRVTTRSGVRGLQQGEMAAAAAATPQADSSVPDRPFKVLLVDTREKFRTAMLLKLARSGHRVFPVGKAREAIDVFTREKSDLVLIHRDSLLETGAEFVRRIRATSSYVPILVHGGRPGAGDVGSLKNGVDITVIANAGDDSDVLVDMIDCSLAATRCIRSVRDDQEVRGKILSEICFNLRSSLDVISGYTDILSDEPDLSQFKEMLDRMRASTTAASVQMQSYVDVALDAPENVRQERFDLSTLSEKILRLVSRQIGTHPLRLTTTGPLEGSALFTDGEKLLAILSHVVTDAIRFTPTGEINIAVKSKPDHTDFIVTDAGPGISADVPMPFASVAPNGSDGGSASGIGLAIAERLSRSIGATLRGTCGEGGAAEFTISVPSKLMTPSTEAVSRMIH